MAEEELSSNDEANERPAGSLNPLTDDAHELFCRALEEAGYPTQYVDALRKYGDPRPRRPLSDGQEIRVEYAPPLPSKRVVREHFIRLCAAEIGAPIDRHQQRKFWRALEDVSHSLSEAVRTAAWDEEAGPKIADALSDPPDPSDKSTWNEWADQAWKKIRSALGGPLMRHVLGGQISRGEGKAREVQIDPDGLYEERGVPAPGDPDYKADSGSEIGGGSLHEIEAQLWTEEVITRANLTEAEAEVWALNSDGHRRKEIAELTNRAIGTVDSLLHRARQKLRDAAS